MHNRVVRFILNLGPRSHIGQRELDQVGLLSVKDRVIQMKLNHVFKIVHGTAPDYLSSNFTRISTVHKYSTRGSSVNFIVPSSKGQMKTKPRLEIPFILRPFTIGIFCQKTSRLSTICQFLKRQPNNTLLFKL